MAQQESDVQLLRRAARDSDAFATFYSQHALALFRWFAYRVEREGTVAAELTAETFAEALRSLPRFRGTAPGSGTAWLFGIARNLAREHHRSRRVRNDARRDLGFPLDLVYHAELEDASERLDAEGRRHELVQALAELPVAQRRAITLRVVNDLDYAAIAALTASSEQSVRLRVSRGLRTLRAQLSAVPSEENA
jgi:RNA polymerase sigma factor (sigma-70 family)